jgi:hypothetical protein
MTFGMRTQHSTHHWKGDFRNASSRLSLPHGRRKCSGSTCRAAVALLALSPLFAIAKGDLLESAVIGGAQGIIMGVCLILYLWVWRPLKKRRDERKRQRTIEMRSLTPLMIAAADGKDAEVIRLLDEGADVNAVGSAGESALILASQNDRRSTVRLLASRGTNLMHRTPKGNSARDIARQHKHLILADILGELEEATG